MVQNSAKQGAGGVISGTATGDLSGTYPNPTVAAIEGNTVSSGALTKGQFLVASSTSNWAATTLSGDVSESSSTAGKLTVTGLQGNAVSNASPSDGNVLTWVAADSKWEPIAPNAASATYGQLTNVSNVTINLTTAFTKILWDTTGISNGTTLSTTNHRITVGSTGIYRILAMVEASLSSSSTTVTTTIYKNGSQITSADASCSTTFDTTINFLNLDTIISLSANDYIEIFIKGSGSVTFNLSFNNFYVWEIH